MSDIQLMTIAASWKLKSMSCAENLSIHTLLGYNLEDEFQNDCRLQQNLRIQSKFSMDLESLWSKEEIKNLENYLSASSDAWNPSSEDYCNDLESSLSSKSTITAADLQLVYLSLKAVQVKHSSNQLHQDDQPRQYTFYIDKIKRTGSRHGCGGRPCAPTTAELQKSICLHIAARVCRLLISLCDRRIEEVSKKLKECLLKYTPRYSTISTDAIPCDFSAALEKTLRRYSKRQRKDQIRNYSMSVSMRLLRKLEK